MSQPTLRATHQIVWPIKRCVCHTSENREELATQKWQRLSPCLGFHFDMGLESEDIWLPENLGRVPVAVSLSPIAVGLYYLAALVTALLHCQTGDIAAFEPCGSCSLGSWNSLRAQGWSLLCLGAALVTAGCGWSLGHGIFLSVQIRSEKRF